MSEPILILLSLMSFGAALTITLYLMGRGEINDELKHGWVEREDGFYYEGDKQ